MTVPCRYLEHLPSMTLPRDFWGLRPRVKLLTYQISLSAGQSYVSRTVSQLAQSCPTLCDPMDGSTPAFPVHHQLPEFAQTYAHRVGDAIQLSRPLSSPSPPAFNLSQRQGLFQWVSSSHQVAKVLELQHQSFQWIFRTGVASYDTFSWPDVQV